jgi:hypothetical protein
MKIFFYTITRFWTNLTLFIHMVNFQKQDNVGKPKWDQLRLAMLYKQEQNDWKISDN